MRSAIRTPFNLAIAAAGSACAAVVLHAEPGHESVGGEGDEAAIVERVGVVEARGRAKLLHEVHLQTLHVIHRRYFDRDEKDMIPARALEEVFKAADEGTGRTTRWIAVNTPPMNVDHAAAPGFETAAVAALAAGEESFEAVEGGVYRHTAPVRLFAGCLRCHESSLTKQVVNPRIAGLVVGIPVETE